MLPSWETVYPMLSSQPLKEFLLTKRLRTPSTYWITEVCISLLLLCGLQVFVLHLETKQQIGISCKLLSKNSIHQEKQFLLCFIVLLFSREITKLSMKIKIRINDLEENFINGCTLISNLLISLVPNY